MKTTNLKRLNQLAQSQGYKDHEEAQKVAAAGWAAYHAKRNYEEAMRNAG